MKIAAADFSGRFEQGSAGGPSDGLGFQNGQDQAAGRAIRSLKGVTIRTARSSSW